MQLVSESKESSFGCLNGMHSDLAPMDGAPGSAGSSLADFFLMISSQDGSPQNGARINYIRNAQQIKSEESITQYFRANKLMSQTVNVHLFLVQFNTEHIPLFNHSKMCIQFFLCSIHIISDSHVS